MTALNGLLTFGVLAFTIPLAIHLFFRSKFRTLPWGAMHLLNAVVRINRRRIQLLNLLLLLLRCFIPVLLAFCLARPVLTGFRALPGDAPRSVVLAIDDSRSMQIAATDGRTRWQTARDSLTTLLDSLSRRDEVMIVRASRYHELVGTMGAANAKRNIMEMGTSRDPVDGASIDLGRLIRAAIDAASEASHSQREIVVVSDFQNHEVDEFSLRTLRQAGQSLQNAPLRPTIRFLSVANSTGEHAMGNLSVDEITSDAAAVVSGRQARFSARIHNHGDNDSGDVRLTWTVGDNVQRPRTIRVPAKSSKISRLTLTIDDLGVQPVTVSIEHADALSADNERSIGVDVIKEVRVLIVDGKPGKEAFEGEADFLAIALSPFAFGNEDQPDAVRSEVISADQLPQRIADQKCDVVVLAGLKAPSNNQKQAVANFVAQGGNVLVFPARDLDQESYAGVWGDGDVGFQLPMTYSSWVGTMGPEAPQRFPVGKRNGAYSPWDLLGDADDDLFGNVEISAYHKLEPWAGTGDDSGRLGSVSPMTLLALASGEPLVASGKMVPVKDLPVPSGRVIQFAIPANVRGSTLPLRPLFLPMMQQLILDLAGSQKQTTHEIGQPFSVPLDEIAGDRSAKQLSNDQFLIRAPESSNPALTGLTKGRSVRPLGLEDGVNESVGAARIPVPVTTRRGVYQLVRKSTAAEKSPADWDPQSQTIRVVEVPAVESDARVTGLERLTSAAELVGGSVYRDASRLISDDQTSRYGREIWHWLLLAMLLLMIGELFLQQRLTNPTGQTVVKTDVGSWSSGAVSQTTASEGTVA